MEFFIQLKTKERSGTATPRGALVTVRRAALLPGGGYSPVEDDGVTPWPYGDYELTRTVAILTEGTAQQAQRLRSHLTTTAGVNKTARVITAWWTLLPTVWRDRLQEAARIVQPIAKGPGATIVEASDPSATPVPLTTFSGVNTVSTT